MTGCASWTLSGSASRCRRTSRSCCSVSGAAIGTYRSGSGTSEASAIAYAQQGVVPPRPLTHDLMKDLIAAFGRRLEEVRIVAIRDNVFHAELAFDGGLTVGSRSSDAIALALRTGTRIVGSDAVLEEGGVAVPDEDEDEVEKFREFLDQISPEDFEKGAPGTTTGEAGPV